MNCALFKFCTAKGARRMLQSRSIYISSPLDLNDPFEMRPAWTNEHAERAWTEQELKNRAIEGHPIAICTEDGIVPSGTRMPRQDPQPHFDVESTYGISDLYNGRAFQIMHRRLRLLCFSEQVFDPYAEYYDSKDTATLMWSHYADDFRGVCVAIDPSKIHGGVIDGGIEIDYGESRRSLPAEFYDGFLRQFFDAGGLEMTSSCASDLLVPSYFRHQQEFDQLIDILRAKSHVWHYEKERRFVYDIETLRADGRLKTMKLPCFDCADDGRDSDNCKHPREQMLIDLPPAAVIAVAIGVHASASATKQIMKLLEDDDYDHVRTFWTDVHSHRYCIRFANANRDEVFKHQQARATSFGQARYEP